MIVCAAAQELIDAFVTESLSPSDAASLAEHVRTCPACAARLGSVTRLTELLASLPAIEPSPGFEERQLAAAITDRVRRHEHRSWLAQLRIQVLRGAMRTTGTLAATIAAVALLGAAFVLAASNLFPGIAQQVLQGHSTPRPSAPVTAIGPATAQPTPTLRVVESTPSPTPAPPTQPPATHPAPTTPPPTVAPSPSPTPESTPIVAVAPTAEPSASPAASPTPSPSTSSTPKPRRCPPDTPCAVPTPSPTPTAAPASSPAAPATTLP